MTPTPWPLYLTHHLVLYHLYSCSELAPLLIIKMCVRNKSNEENIEGFFEKMKRETTVSIKGKLLMLQQYFHLTFLRAPRGIFVQEIDSERELEQFCHYHDRIYMDIYMIYLIYMLRVLGLALKYRPIKFLENMY